MPERITRCKFKCREVTKMEGWAGHKILYSAKLYPVTGGSEENEKFYGATPGGSLDVQAVTADVFEPGKEYYLDITEVPSPAEAGPA